MQTALVSLPGITDNNLVLKYYDSSYYDSLPLITSLVTVLGYLATGVFVLGFIFSSRLIAVEMILIFQISYGGLIMIAKLECYMDTLKNLWIVNGYNSLFPDSP